MNAAIAWVKRKLGEGEADRAVIARMPRYYRIAYRLAIVAPQAVAILALLPFARVDTASLSDWQAALIAFAFMVAIAVGALFEATLLVTARRIHDGGGH